MAQGDIFSKLVKNGGGFELFQRTGVITMGEYNKLLSEALEREGNIYETKKKMLQSDTKSLNILKKIKDVSEKLYKGMKTAKDMQKSIYKQEEAIESLKKKSRSTGDVDEKRLYDQMIKRKRVELFNNRLILDQTRRTIPVLGSMGKAGSVVSDVMVDIAGTIGSIIPIVGGLIDGILKMGEGLVGLVLAPIKKIFSTFLETQSIVGNLAADIGLTAKESRSLMLNITDLAIEASRFGGTMKDVAEVMQTFSQVTGKNRLFGKDEMGQLIQLGLSTGIGAKGAAEMAGSFDNMGISLSRAINLTNKARDMAARYNVNTTKVMQTYKALVESLTGIGFGKGLENLTKAAAKAEAIRFDIVKSTQSFSDAFFDPDKAVEASAQMQVLGGKFAQSFGDPISLAFESMTDPEALAEKFADTVKGMVRKSSSGDFIIPPAARKQLMLASQALGQDYDNIKNSAIEQAKIADKMTALGRAGQNLFNIREDDKPAIASLMKLNEHGQYVIRNSEGVDRLLSELTDKNQIKQILDDRKKNENAAIERKSLMERLSLIVDRFMLGFNTVLTKLFGSTDMNSFLQSIENAGTQLAMFVSKVDIPGLTKTVKGALEQGKRVFDQILDVFNKDGGLGEKIGKTLTIMFSGIIKPVIAKLIEVLLPLLQAGFGELLRALKDIPLIGGALNRKGTNMVSGAISSDGSGILKGLYTSDEASAINSSVRPTDPHHSMLQGMGILGNMGYKGIKAGGVYGTKLFGRGLAKIGGDVAMGSAAKGGSKLLERVGLGMFKAGESMAAKSIAKHIPIIGSLISAGFAVDDFVSGDWKGGLLQSGSALSGLLDLVAPGAGTAASLAFDGVDAARQMGAFDDGVIYKDGSYGKFSKGDMVSFIDQNAFESRQNGGGGAGTNSRVEHSGTIIIKSEDGKVVTWDDMYNARDLIGGRIASINSGYSGGFGNLQDASISPIKPLK